MGGKSQKITITWIIKNIIYVYYHKLLFLTRERGSNRRMKNFNYTMSIFILYTTTHILLDDQSKGVGGRATCTS